MFLINLNQIQHKIKQRSQPLQALHVPTPVAPKKKAAKTPRSNKPREKTHAEEKAARNAREGETTRRISAARG